VDLVITSPPFALQREKEYGNVTQAKYVDWLLQFCEKVFQVIKDTGSFVLDSVVRTKREDQCDLSITIEF